MFTVPMYLHNIPRFKNCKETPGIAAAATGSAGGFSRRIKHLEKHFTGQASYLREVKSSWDVFFGNFWG